MKKLSAALAFFVILLTTVKCTRDDCDKCFTPPDFFVFEIVDKDSGENLFTNETFNVDDLKILDSSDNEVEFTFMPDNNLNLIQIYTIGWQTETVNYRVNVSSENIFD